MTDSYPRPLKDIASVEEHMRMFRGTGAGAEGVYDSTFSLSTGSSLKVSANGTTNVTVAIGEGSVPGVHLNRTTTKTLAVPTNAGSATARKDLVVMRLTFDGDNTAIDLFYVTGGATEPTVTRNFTTAWEVALAGITVPAGSATVPSGNVSNRRVLVSRPAIIGDGSHRPPVTPGQTLVEPGKVLVGLPNNTWQQVWPVEQAAYTAIEPSSSSANPRFKSGFRNYNEATGVSGFARPAFQFGPGSLVCFQGVVQATSNKAAHSTMFTLPANVRPTSKRVFNQRGGTIDVFENGDVQTGLGMSDNDYIFLDGVNFHTPL